MIERRFITDSGFVKIPMHAFQSITTLRLFGTIDDATAKTEMNANINGETLAAGEETDLIAMTDWIATGTGTDGKIANWFELSAPLECALHEGPLYDTEAKLKTAIEAVIGSSLQ